VNIADSPLVQDHLKLLSATGSKHSYLSTRDKERKRLWQEKEKILAENGLSIYGKFTVHSGENPFSWNLLAVARILHATAQEVTAHQYENVLSDSMISTESESQARQFLRSIMEAMLREYPTSLEEDENILANARIGFEERCAVTIRKQEKAILGNAIQFCLSMGVKCGQGADNEVSLELPKAVATVALPK